jgi:Domain of Unknown Function with PDB structure (DUF3857)/Transglutaminase-like superfamily
VSRQRLLICVSGLLLCFAALQLPTVAADEWQPISPDELKMSSVAEAPGAPAVILYRQVDRDDAATSTHEYNYVRIKILTEEGRKFADVEIPFFREQSDIHSIRARTIRPDGSIVNFEGKAFDKTIVKAKGLKYLAKTFTLPDVQVGSIVEYHYMLDFVDRYVFDSHWILSDELFTRHAKFSLKPNKDFALRWSWPHGLPPNSAPPKDEAGLVRLEAHNVPAFQIEDFMPPENELKFRVDFSYSEDRIENNPEKFWKSKGKSLNGKVESFTGKRKAMEQAVAQMVAPGDTPEAKAEKIYARVQQLRNTSYEVEKTELEQKREKVKTGNVEDILRQGSGDGSQINWLYLALVQAAGIEAYPVYVSGRNEYFFNQQMMNASQLNGNVVLLKLNGKEVYCDPGTAFAPYGLLPWTETAVPGLRLDKDGGSWVRTTLPESSVSTIGRKADLKMGDDGSLSGKVTVTFSGLEALLRRIEMRNEDDTTRKKFLEDQVREYIPVGIDVELTNKPEWKASTPTLVATYDLTVPGWASAAGHRALLPIGLFSATEKQLFEHTSRVHPIYLQFPFQKIDDVTIQLPFSWQVNSLPAPKSTDSGHVVVYSMKVENDRGVLHLTRTLNVDILLLETKYYQALRNFFQSVRTGDEQQIIVQPGAAAAHN